MRETGKYWNIILTWLLNLVSQLMIALPYIITTVSTIYDTYIDDIDI